MKDVPVPSKGWCHSMATLERVCLNARLCGVRLCAQAAEAHVHAEIRVGF